MVSVILVVLVVVGFYLASRHRGNGSASTQAPPPEQVLPSRSRAAATRSPTQVRERAPVPRSAERWDSAGREIPFAEPGLEGPLFLYGGTSLRGGVEHDGPYAVIDFETTGLSPRRDRVVEIAIARVDASGRIEDEFATLINPEGRDVGPTFIHGITNARVKDAPTFIEVAPELLARMSGAVVVAHNATFEEAFLAAELNRAGVKDVSVPALCTLWLGRQTFETPNYKLATLARAGGIPLVDKHTALGDVRAVSALLPQMTRRLRSPLLFRSSPWSWPLATSTGRTSTGGSLSLVTRAVALRKGTDGWMDSLVARLPGSGLAPDDATAEAYLNALSEVLADGRLTGDEANALAHLVGSAGMGGAQVLGLNQRFLDGLKSAALDDNVLTRSEIRQLRTAAKALSLPDHFGDLEPTSPPHAAQTPASPAAESAWSNSMEARGARGQHALAMQRAGSSRAEIAAALEVGQDTVKSLLRDAKFYENPEADPSRLTLARHARHARTAGGTRDHFQSDQALSPGKSIEAWRDAAMLGDRLE